MNAPLSAKASRPGSSTRRAICSASRAAAAARGSDDPLVSRAIVASNLARIEAPGSEGKVVSAFSAAATTAAALSGSSDRDQIAGTSYDPITLAVRPRSPSSSAAAIVARRCCCATRSPSPPVVARLRSRSTVERSRAREPAATALSYAAVVCAHTPCALCRIGEVDPRFGDCRKMSVYKSTRAGPGSTPS